MSCSVLLFLFGAFLLADTAIAVPTAPTTRPEFYDFQLSIPPDCAPSDCTIFAGVNLNEGNDSFVDIYLEGVAQGYVAIGFTETQSMFDADVVACTRDASNNDMVQGLDTWNPGSTRGNQQDNTMDQDLMFFSGSFSNGRIRCSVAKRIIGSDPDQDIDLNSDLYLIITAGPNVATPTSILQHNPQSRNYSTETFSFPPMVATNAPTTTGDETPPPPPEEPTMEPEEYRLLFGQPAGCNRTNCDIFVAINTNNASSGYLDIYLEGEANGWVAVGFTKTSSMFSADVVACNRIPNSDNVEALDTWNPANRRESLTDNQQDIVYFNSGVNDSRLYCSVAKRITSDDTDNDIDLDQGSCYCLVYARSDSSREGALIPHTSNNRFTSGETCDIDPVMDGGTVEGTGISSLRHALTRAHGILMMIAWMLLVLTGMYFSTWMKCTLPNGEWFQIHRALMVAAIFVAFLGFILIFIGNKDNTIPGLIDLSPGIGRTHFFFGITVMVLLLVNPIIALFRCKPDHSKRWIFRMIHGSFLGRIAEAFSLTTIGLGLALFSNNFAGYSNSAAFWLFIAFIIFYVIFIIVHIIVTIISWKMGAYSSCGNCSCSNGCNKCKPEKSNATEMKPVGDKSDLGNDDIKERKTPAKDAPVHWAFFAVLMVVLIPVLIALIVLVALPQE